MDIAVIVPAERLLEKIFLPTYNACAMSNESLTQPFFAEAIAIVGVGLLGGSLGAAIKSNRLARHVVGIGRNPERLQAAQAAGQIDSWSTDAADVVGQTDLIIFCTPVDRIADGIRGIASACGPETLITDVGSIKTAICDELSTGLPSSVAFIGSHPLAGSEKQGFENARANLFDGSVCVVTPDVGADPIQVGRLIAFWTALGANVVEMSAADHDRLLAQTSHVPHVVAAALASQLSDSNRHLAATGFRDTTRIAAGDPNLWVEILLGNAANVRDSVDELAEQLTQFRQAIANRDSAALKKLLQVAKTNRDALGSQ